MCVTHFFFILSLYLSPFFRVEGWWWWLVTTCAGELLIESLPATRNNTRNKKEKKEIKCDTPKGRRLLRSLLVVAVARCQLSATRPLRHTKPCNLHQRQIQPSFSLGAAIPHQPSPKTMREIIMTPSASIVKISATKTHIF